MPKNTPLVSYKITDLPQTNDKEYAITWKESGKTVRVRTGDSEYHGKGLFCAQPLISKGTHIDHYHGETVSSGTAHKKYAANMDSFYLHSSDVIIPLPHIPGRYINDSVQLPEVLEGPLVREVAPNVIFDEPVPGRVIVRALRDIHEGEELLVSYGDWYWRGLLLERAGFEDAPNRFEWLNQGASDQKRLKKWLKEFGWDSLPEDLRLVKVKRHRQGEKNHVWDYYLIKRGEWGVWRSLNQYKTHVDCLQKSIPCGCEVCRKPEGGKKRKRDATGEIEEGGHIAMKSNFSGTGTDEDLENKENGGESGGSIEDKENTGTESDGSGDVHGVLGNAGSESDGFGDVIGVVIDVTGEGGDL